ncbi:MAG: hypothetical protein KA717_12075 [Woronichinia naegeliana WA131]|uniref:Uncharacterized protein n=1 Tax=Woronichinia naegeliana WA131 TaxID=2824559 RepID=A0A977L0L4_9CYAN|nr:MAG: hypothetical protein KA717_12075 [Woronichinia naegeliana WA131]
MSNLGKKAIAVPMSNLRKKAIAVLREMFYDRKIQIITTNKLMAIAQSLNFIRYVTNSEGKTTDVLVPMEIWQQIIHWTVGSLWMAEKVMTMRPK